MSYRTVCFVMFLWNSLTITAGVQKGCNIHEHGPDNNVCCVECHEGNRLVERCGRNPADLCVPCKNGTFAETKSSRLCRSCNQCANPLEVQTPCTLTADTVCRCRTGFVCANEDCSVCSRICEPGQQRVRGRCEKCPEGMFNNQPNGLCAPWTKCPPGFVVIQSGTTLTDNKCDISNEITPIVKRSTPQIIEIHNSKKPEDKDDWGIPAVLTVTGVFIVLVIIAIFCMILRAHANKAPQKQPAVQPPKTPESVRHLPVEEECSFCQPQQEQGSIESISTQDSLEKLLPPV